MSDLPSILKPNATLHERAIEQAIRKGDPDLTPVSALMNPDTCPAHLLGWLAWAFSVDVWKASWPEDIKRQVIRDAIPVHRLKGTRKSVELALEALGFNIDLVEAWQEGGAPHTFRLDAYANEVIGSGFALDPSLRETVDRLIANVKPVRAHYTLRIGQSFDYDATARFGLKARRIMRDDVAPTVPARSSEAGLFARSALRARATMTDAMMPAVPSRESRFKVTARAMVRARQTIRGTFTFPVNKEAPYAA